MTHVVFDWRTAPPPWDRIGPQIAARLRASIGVGRIEIPNQHAGTRTTKDPRCCDVCGRRFGDERAALAHRVLHG